MTKLKARKPTWGGRASRRGWLKASLSGLAAGGLSNLLCASASAALPPARDLRVARIDRVTVRVPFRDTPGRNMARELPHWMYSEIFTVELQSGHKGFGETLLYYTWGVSGDKEVERVRGKNAAAVMWDDSLGAGLQMALFDAVARAADVPIHHLLGHQVRQRAGVSWWNIDTSPEDMAAECREAHRQGYLAYKTKGRPWFDIWNQVDMAAQAVPDSFQIDMDFNGALLDAERAIPVLKDLEAYPQIRIYETPIPQRDIEGNRAIRKATRVAIAMHYGDPPPAVALKHDICDGFVIGGGASRVVQQGAAAAMADKPFWLQMAGTGLTAAFSLHFGAVLSHARWPAVNCFQLYTHCLLRSPIRVQQGLADVPEEPGLGFDIDWDAVERFRVEKPSRRPDPPRLIETAWPDGRRMYFAETGRVNFVLDPACQGKTPYFERGVATRLVPDDGSDRWRRLHEQARKGPLMLKD